MLPLRALPVLHDEALAERLGELRCDDARDDVRWRRPGRRERGCALGFARYVLRAPRPWRAGKTASVSSLMGWDHTAMKTIDIHAHWYPEEWIRPVREGRGEGGRVPRAQGRQVPPEGEAHHERVRRTVLSLSLEANQGDGQAQGRRPCALAHHADGLLGLAGIRPRAQPGVQRRRLGRAPQASRATARPRDAADAVRPSSR